MEEQRSEVSEALERLIFLSDGVFAIATYALSFIILSVYWTTHQRIFHYIKRADNVLIWLNVFFLLCIAFLPVPTKVLGLQADQQAAVIFYIGSLTVAGLFIILLWWYATSNHRLVEKQLDAALIRHHMQRALIGPLIFVLSIASPSSIRFLLR
jgi:uncharacterized membrane protein